MTESKNLPATKGSAGVATVEEVPEFLKAHAGEGNENVTRNDMVLPRIGIIQALSPQIKRNDPAYIPGAEQGDIFNTLTGDLYKGGVLMVNTYFVAEVAVFKKRTAGGGFRGTFPNMAAALEFIKVHPESADLEAIEQGIHYVLILDEARKPIAEAAMVFQITKLKVSRKWNSLIELRPNTPRYGVVWKIGTVEETNSRNQSYFNFTVAPSGFVDEATAAAAKKLYESVKGGQKQVDRTENPGAAAETEIEY